MFQAGKAAVIANEMAHYNLSVLGLAETRWTQSGEVKLASGESITTTTTLDMKMKEHTIRRDYPS